MAITAITEDFVTKSGLIVEGTGTVTSSTGQTTALQVNSGAAIAKNLIVGTTATISGNLFVNNTATISLSASVGTTLTVGTTATINGNLIVSGHTRLATMTATGVVSIIDTTAATSGAIGSLVVTGGAYIAKNLIVASTASSTGTALNNSLYVAGGVGINKNLVVSGTAVFQDDVIFNGTATYVYSANTVYTDNILELHTPNTGTPGVWSINDGKDIGLRFHYYSGSNKNAALVLANDTKYLEWYVSGAEGIDTFTSGVYGTFRTGNILLTNTTNATTTQSGTLQVAGGIGVGQNIYVGGTVTSPTFIGNLQGVATTATNIEGGSTGTILYQSSAGTTEFLGIGTPGYVLYSSGTEPYWAPVSSFVPDFANTATNLKFGDDMQIPFQIGTGTTSFEYNLRYDYNANSLRTVNAVFTGTENSISSTSGAVQVVGGVGVGGSVYVSNNVTANTITATNLLINGIYAKSYLSTYGSLFIDASSGNQVIQASTNNLANGFGIWTAGLPNSVVYSSGGIEFSTSKTLRLNNTPTGGNTFMSLSTSGALTLSGTSTSISTTTGALTVAGGVGIGGNTYIGGDIYISGQTNVSGSIIPSSGTASLGSLSSPFTELYVGYNSLYVGRVILSSTGSQLVVTSLNGPASLTIPTISITSATVSAGTGTGALTVTGGVGIGGALYVNDRGNFLSATSSTSISTGALIVTGGVGIGGALYVNETSYVNSAEIVTSATIKNFAISSITAGTDTAISTSTGDVTLWNISSLQSVTDKGSSTTNAISITNITSATSFTTGALIVSGGVGVGGALYINDESYINNAVILTRDNIGAFGVAALVAGTDTAISTSTGAVIIWNTSTLQTVSDRGNSTTNQISIFDSTESISTATGGLVVTGGIGLGKSLHIGNTVTILGTAVSVSTTTGALTVAGGVGIGGDMYIKGTIYGVATTATNLSYGTVGQVPFQTNTGTTGFFGPGNVGQILVSNGASAGGPIFTDTSTFVIGYSTSTIGGSPGSILYQSAVDRTAFIGIGANDTFLRSNGSTATFVTTSSMLVGRSALANNVAGGLAGSVLYQSAPDSTTSIPIGDSGFLLQSNGSIPQWVSVGTLSAGTANAVSITTDNASAVTHYLTFVNTATDSAGINVSAPTGITYVPATGNLGIGITTATAKLEVVGGVKISGITTLTNTTVASSTLTGALRVTGGVGIGGTVYIGGNINVTGNGTFTGDIAVNGGDITSNQTTFNLLTTAATTVNFAKAATTLSIGSSTGITTVNNNLTVVGNLTVQGTTTIVDSTVTNFTDPILILGGLANNQPLTGNDNKDKGVAFKYWSGSARTGFFGYKDTTGFFTFLTSATITNEVVTGTKGALDANIAGGSSQSLIYQSSPNTTAFLTAGTSGQILQTNGTGSAPSWTSLSAVVVGNATTATRVETVSGVTNATHYLTFVDSNNTTSTGELLYTTSSFSINPATGNVGIGTASPTVKLDIAGTGTAVTQLIWARGNNDTAFVSSLRTGDAGVAAYQSTIGVDYAGYTDFSRIKFYRATTLGEIHFFTGGLAGNGTEKMRIDSVGNLMIGATSVYGGGAQEGKLTIVGGAPTADITRGNMVLMDNRAYNIPPLFTIMMGGQYNSASATTQFSGIGGGKENATDGDSAGFLAFYTRVNSGVRTEHMRITSNGGIAFGGASNYGTGGQILQSNGNAPPAWVNLSGVSAGLATTSTQLNTVQQISNGTYYPTFVDSNNATAIGELYYTTSSFYVNPNARELYVDGTARFTTPVNGSTGAIVLRSNATNTATTYIQWTNNNSSLQYAAIGVTVANSMTFITSSVGTEAMRITSNGGISFGASGTAYGSSGQILQSNGDTAPTWVSTSSFLVGNATNLAGGGLYQVVYQSAVGTTAYLPAGTAGQILQTNGTSSAPTWISTGSLTAANANTAINLLGGTAGQVPYQVSPSTTGFFGPGTAGNVLVSNGTSVPTYNNTLTLASNTAATNTSTGALQVKGGVGIGGSVYVGNRVGFVNASNVSTVYQYYNATTNSLDTVFG